MEQIPIRPFDLTDRLSAVLSVMSAALELGEAGSQERTRIVLRHAGRPGLVSRGAFVDGRMVAFCYGFPIDRTAWWETQIRPHLIASGTVDWLDGGAFELTELHVRPDHQGRGLGRRLITQVLDGAGSPRALLSVRASARPARALYSSLGFRDLTASFQFGAGQQPYRVMGVRLPLAGQDAGRPAGMAYADRH